jgi:O-antigen biosynthesis protein
VEETRAFALEQCSHDWIAFLDDDEMFSPGAIEYLHTARAAAVVALPRRHWILGEFNPDAYYWPEHQIRFFRKGALTFLPVVHGGMEIDTDHIDRVSPETQIFIEHLSHRDTEQWIERTNRYTSQPRRVAVDSEAADLIDFAHQRIDYWLARSRQSDRSDYPAAVALLRAIYDMVDRIKAWEGHRSRDGEAAFQMRCMELERAYDDLEQQLGIKTGSRR